jgi:uncharacterized protein HemX
MSSPTTVVDRPALWTSLPGWGIAADLTPPELINKRQLKVLIRLMALGLVLLVLVCFGGYYLAAHDRSAASADLQAAQARTTDLQRVGRSYNSVVAIQGSVDQVQAQVAQVMGGDVDLVALLVQLESNLPKTMVITQEAISISTAGVAAATTTGAATGSGLDTSGLPRIGTLTISGTGQRLDDLSDYVDDLQTIAGLVDVLPVSNTATSATSGTQFSITIGLTNALLSHRFDVGGG